MKKQAVFLGKLFILWGGCTYWIKNFQENGLQGVFIEIMWVLLMLFIVYIVFSLFLFIFIKKGW